MSEKIFVLLAENNFNAYMTRDIHDGIARDVSTKDTTAHKKTHGNFLKERSDDIYASERMAIADLDRGAGAAFGPHSRFRH